MPEERDPTPTQGPDPANAEHDPANVRLDDVRTTRPSQDEREAHMHATQSPFADDTQPRHVNWDLGATTLRPTLRAATSSLAAFPTHLTTTVAAGIGIVAFITFHKNFGVGDSILLALLSLSLLASERFVSPLSKAALLISLQFPLWYVLHDDRQLSALNMLTCILLLFVAAFWSRSGNLFRSSLMAVISRKLSIFSQPLHAHRFFLQPIAANARERRERMKSVLLGFIFALPVLFIFGALLTASDKVFAHLIHQINLGNLLQRLAVGLILTWFVALLLHIASSHFVDNDEALRKPLGVTESITILSAVVVLFLAFVMVQVNIWIDGTQHVLRTAGLTYAEHARQGFFELLAVAFLTLLLLFSLHAFSKEPGDAQRRVLMMLSTAVSVLTLVLVGCALQRLFMYEHAFGLSVTRVYAIAIAIWIGLLFVLHIATSFRTAQIATTDASADVKPSARTNWFALSSVVVTLVMLFLLNTVSPERLVVERNIARVHDANAGAGTNAASVQFDATYLGTLSPDGIAAVASHFDELRYAQQREFLSSACAQYLSYGATSGFSYNAARKNAADFLQKHCAVPLSARLHH